MWVLFSSLYLFAWATKSSMVAFGVNANTDPYAWLKVSLTGLPRQPITLWCCSDTCEWQACGELTDGVLARAVSVELLLFASADHKKSSAVCADLFFKQWACVSLSPCFYLGLKMKIALLPVLFAIGCWEGCRLAKLTQFGTSQIFALFSLDKSCKRTSKHMLQFKL